MHDPSGGVGGKKTYKLIIVVFVCVRNVFAVKTAADKAPINDKTLF